MNVHRLIMLLARLLIDETRTNTLDLDSSSRFLLDVLHEHTLRNRWQY